MRTDPQLILIRNIATAITAVVNDTPTGAPADLLYAALTDHCTRLEFNRIMRTLIEAERIAERGGRYYPINQRGTP